LKIVCSLQSVLLIDREVMREESGQRKKGNVRECTHDM